jgi:hypothetical protein
VGAELVSVCVFCASVLFRTELVPPAGISAEIAGSYGTIQRKYDTPPNVQDFSNITPKFVLIGLREARPAEGDLGAGTPAREWRARFALGPSHDDQDQRPLGALGHTTASGTGRYENIAALYRQPIDAADSIEAGWVRRKQASTDGLNLGNTSYVLAEQRILGSERDDWGLDWRHRFRGVEIAVSGRFTNIDAGNATAAFSGAYGGHLLGGGLEARWQTGRFTFQAHGETLSGNLDSREESFPSFAPRVFKAPASFRTVSVAAAYAWAKTDVIVSYSYDRNHLPFTTFAVLGIEQNALDSGFHSDARLSLSGAELRIRTRIGEGIQVYVTGRAVLGDETVTLTDSAGVAPPRTLKAHWAEIGNLATLGGGAPAFVISAGAEFAIGGGRRP